jgi:hypothetical protein
MSLEVALIADLSSVAGILFNSAFKITAKHVKLGRMLYTAGLYRIDDFATAFNTLAAALQIVRLLSLADCVLTLPSHSFSPRQ